MKKIIYSLIAIIASMGLANAQDVVIMNNGDEIRAKVLEITSDEVKYRLYEEPDGVIYSVWKSDILMIHYESGRSEVFTHKVMPRPYYSGREPLYDIRPGMKYRELKHLYNHKDYISVSGDLNPAWSGVASFFIPGLGECINEEWGRGLGKFFGSAALVSAAAVFTQVGFYGEEGGPLIIAAACYAGALGLNIWSIVDAIRIAKVKNMYEQDLRQVYSFNLDLYPSVNCIQMGNTMQPTVGFTLALQF
ncbi:MAG: hypothetical protein GXY75_05465 [Bacteroidales bacterium]|jgi:hypothetical protein|nr:hypothetical protein [Bacteroidales bacterium]